MILFAIVRADGSLAGVGQCVEGDLEHQAVPEGGRIVERPVTVGTAAGWRYASGAFVEQPVEVPAIAAPSLSRIAYQRLFTQAERIAIRGSADPIVVDFRDLAALAETIDLDDADVAAGTHYLESLGLIGPGRAAAILAGQAPA